jgi:hypothetical protein
MGRRMPHPGNAFLVRKAGKVDVTIKWFGQLHSPSRQMLAADYTDYAD